MAFSLDEIDRYERQVLLPEWGAAGQERLRASSVVVRGDGAAAELAARYLAAAGVGQLVVADGLAVDIARLNPHVAVRGGAPAGGAALEVGAAILVAASQDHATGAALAVEGLKAILGLPHRARVSLAEGAAT